MTPEQRDEMRAIVHQWAETRWALPPRQREAVVALLADHAELADTIWRLEGKLAALVCGQAVSDEWRINQDNEKDDTIAAKDARIEELERALARNYSVAKAVLTKEATND